MKVYEVQQLIGSMTQSYSNIKKTFFQNIEMCMFIT